MSGAGSGTHAPPAAAVAASAAATAAARRPVGRPPSVQLGRVVPTRTVRRRRADGAGSRGEYREGREDTETRETIERHRETIERHRETHRDAMTASGDLGGEYVGQLRAEIDSLAGTGQFPHAQRLLYQGKSNVGDGVWSVKVGWGILGCSRAARPAFREK